MDSSVVICPDGHLEVVENRNLKKGDKVILGRTECCEEGIYVHCTAFMSEEDILEDKFVFRQGRSRETSFARDYDTLFELLKHEKEHGNIVWVMGPAFAFDYDARNAMQALIENGYAHGLMAGNALATHDLEGALLNTALGQDIYTQKSRPNGHYNHLDVLNKVRRSGSIPQFIEDYKIDNGIIYSCVKNEVPFVLTGSEAGSNWRRVQRSGRDERHGTEIYLCNLSCYHAPYHCDGKYDSVFPGNAGWYDSSDLPLYRGCGRVCSE